MDDLFSTMKVAGTGLQAQGRRMRVVSENIANAASTGNSPGADPYRRKLVSFRNFLDRKTGAELVKVAKIHKDLSDFKLQYEPNHPAANADGYVKYPNVSSIIEFSDMREAQLSYQANLNIISSTRQMVQRTIELLK
jgi:flagellar basal-body rod protein FlgC